MGLRSRVAVLGALPTGKTGAVTGLSGFGDELEKADIRHLLPFRSLQYATTGGKPPPAS